MDKQRAKQIADTIRMQMGGNRLAVMTGAKNFTFDTNGELSFRIPRAKNGINCVRISLNGLDLYDMELIKIKRGTYELIEINKATNVYNDQLQAVFTENTGLYTHL